jgi:hypothetical protein
MSNRLLDGTEKRASLPAEPAEYDSFLYAVIGDERNGTPLSVISLLARLDLDPWQEAARIAQLPKDLGVRNVATMISDVPGGCWQPSECEPLALRIVDLLPNRKKSKSKLPSERLSLRIACALAFTWMLFVTLLGAFSFQKYQQMVGTSARIDPPASASVHHEARRPLQAVSQSNAPPP